MVSQVAIITNTTGIHARPAAELVTTAKKFNSEILIKKANKTDEDGYNAKSIIQVLSGSFTEGTEIVIQAQGTDEAAAVKAIVELIKDDFGE